MFGTGLLVYGWFMDAEIFSKITFKRYKINIVDKADWEHVILLYLIILLFKPHLFSLSVYCIFPVVTH